VGAPCLVRLRIRMRRGRDCWYVVGVFGLIDIGGLGSLCGVLTVGLLGRFVYGSCLGFVFCRVCVYVFCYFFWVFWIVLGSGLSCLGCCFSIWFQGFQLLEGIVGVGFTFSFLLVVCLVL